MIKRLVALLLLSLTLAGCIVEPGGGWGDRDHHDSTASRESMATGAIKAGFRQPNCRCSAGSRANDFGTRV